MEMYSKIITGIAANCNNIKRIKHRMMKVYLDALALNPHSLNFKANNLIFEFKR